MKNAWNYAEFFFEIQQDIKCKLFIKEHPFDVFRKKYFRKRSECIKWLNPASSTIEILNHELCLGTVVLNSTVGLESLIFNKPVLALGAIYIIEHNLH